ncbi:hypothetical protein [Mesoplasma coleopterae]|uniref:hypothetical protein n=1 Tax=Mesoplasma coleopterae TaxID=324078 RepID=UPI000D03A46B|nr:hypothetical protein [Mesoplasma coleopterae]AVN63230.1 hypothetical protein CG000_02955 [Mesoplasma coleopterae]
MISKEKQLEIDYDKIKKIIVNYGIDFNIFMKYINQTKYELLNYFIFKHRIFPNEENFSSPVSKQTFKISDDLKAGKISSEEALKKIENLSLSVLKTLNSVKKRQNVNRWQNWYVGHAIYFGLLNWEVADIFIPWMNSLKIKKSIGLKKQFNIEIGHLALPFVFKYINDLSDKGLKNVVSHTIAKIVFENFSLFKIDKIKFDKVNELTENKAFLELWTEIITITQRIYSHNTIIKNPDYFKFDENLKESIKSTVNNDGEIDNLIKERWKILENIDISGFGFLKFCFENLCSFEKRSFLIKKIEELAIKHIEQEEKSKKVEYDRILQIYGISLRDLIEVMFSVGFNSFILDIDPRELDHSIQLSNHMEMFSNFKM